MFKAINTLLLLILLTACSTQEKHDDNNESNKSTPVETKVKQEANATEISPNKVEENATKIEIPKTVTKTQKKNTPLFTLTTIEGEVLHLDEIKEGLSFKEYKDQAVLVLFFGHKCPPCLAEIPVLIDLVKKEHKDLKILAFEVQGYNKEQLKAFKESKGINYPLITYDTSAHFINYISQRANWNGAIPFLIGFDKKGEVKVIHAGGLGSKDFEEIYKSLIK